MLSFQIRSMKKTIQGMLKRKRPPVSVMILRDHALYLGLVTEESDPRPKKSREELGGATPYDLCTVKLVDLVPALRDAKGVDEGIDLIV